MQIYQKRMNEAKRDERKLELKLIFILKYSVIKKIGSISVIANDERNTYCVIVHIHLLISLFIFFFLSYILF